ncbi:MAG: response regulator transcription factor [Acidimicrobiia bacterium]
MRDGERISVFLVDDHDIFRAGTRTFLGDFDIVGEARTSTEAIAEILETEPDVALVDVHIDGVRSGANVIAAVKQERPGIKCVALTASAARADVAECLAAGVDGYLIKEDSGELLPDAVRDVMADGTPISPDIASYLLDIDAFITEERPIEHQLTPREREVVTCIIRGYTYREGASHLGMAVKTFESHMAHIFEKLELSTRAELTRRAQEQGFEEQGFDW